MTIYFGCRDRNIDNIFESELKLYQEEDVLQDVYFAFSREPGKKKVKFYFYFFTYYNRKSVFLHAYVNRGTWQFCPSHYLELSTVLDHVQLQCLVLLNPLPHL